MYKIRLNKVRKSLPKNYSLKVQCLNGNVKMQSSPLGFWWNLLTLRFHFIDMCSVLVTSLLLSLCSGPSLKYSYYAFTVFLIFFSPFFSMKFSWINFYVTELLSTKKPIKFDQLQKNHLFSSSLTAVTFAISLSSRQVCYPLLPKKSI